MPVGSPLPAPRTFGVEVEFSGNTQEIKNALVGAGIPCDTGSYSSQPQGRRFIICPDSSLHDGAELKSPVLNFGVTEDRELLSHAVKVAEEQGGMKTSPQAGIHVHISSEGFTVETMRNIVRFFTKFEDPIYRIASSGWETMRPSAASYCPPINEELVKRLVASRDITAMQYHTSRGCGLNLESHWNKRTVEFRIFNSSVNHERIQAYVALSAAIVRDAEYGWKRSIGKAFKLGGMAAGVVREKTVRDYFFRCLKGNAERPGISKADAKLLARCWKDSKPQTAFGGTTWR